MKIEKRDRGEKEKSSNRRMPDLSSLIETHHRSRCRPSLSDHRSAMGDSQLGMETATRSEEEEDQNLTHPTQRAISFGATRQLQVPPRLSRRRIIRGSPSFPLFWFSRLLPSLLRFFFVVSPCCIFTLSSYRTSVRRRKRERERNEMLQVASVTRQ